MSRLLFRSILELRAPAIATSSTSRLAVLPIHSRVRAFTSTTPIIDPVQPPHNNACNPTRDEIRPIAFKKSHPSPPPTPIQDSVKNLLPILAAQPGHYITVHIHGFPYLVQEGDMIRLPARMPGVLPGDVLRLNRASVLGSRDFTMKGAPHIDERLFECRATVLGVDAEPMRITIKTKRRQRRKKHVKTKHRHTLLRISELKIKDLEDVE